MSGRWHGGAVLLAAAVMLVPGSLLLPGVASPGAPTSPVAPSDRAIGSTVPGPSGPSLLPWAVRAGPVALNPPVNVLVDVPCNSSGNAEVVQAFDPATGNLYEAWIGCGGIGFSRSTDGGATFEPALTVPGSTPPLGSSWDPAIALAPNGTVYVAFMVDVPGDAPVVAWSWDLGQTFAGFGYAFTPSPNEFSDRDFLAVAPNGTLYVTWDYSPNASQDVIGCALGGSCYFTNGDYNIVCA
ncbi:MAG TPA: sialidase family protein, partial [Thermoplasmata archaeon]